MDSLTTKEVENYARAIDMAGSTTDKRDLVLTIATDIFRDRNSKYKDAWRDYRPSTIIDRNLVKARRLRELDEQGLMDEVLEQALDQVNENLFLAILILENKAQQL